MIPEALLLIKKEKTQIVIKGPVPALPPHVKHPPSKIVIVGAEEARCLSHTEHRLIDCATHDGPLFLENTAHDIYVDSTDQLHGTTLSCDAPDALSELHRTENHIHFRWKTGDDVGRVQFDYLVHGHRGVHIELEVFPAKVDYATDYSSMRNDLQAIARALFYRMFGRARLGAESSESRRGALVEWWAIFKELAESFVRTSERISRYPRHMLEESASYRSADRSRGLSRAWARGGFARERRWTRAAGGALAVVTPKGVRVTPAAHLEMRAEVTYDTSENRLALAHILRTIADLTEMLRAVRQPPGDLGLPPKRSRTDVEAQLRMFHRRLANVASGGVWRTVNYKRLPDHIPLALLQDPLYYRLYRQAQVLGKGIRCGGNVFWISPKQTWLLYEYWCFYKIVDLLSKWGDLVQGDAVRFQRSGPELRLVKGMESAVMFRGPRGEVVEVTYNRLFPDLPTVSQQPDNVIQIKAGPNPEDLSELCILDAKYRLDFSEEYVRSYGSPGPQVDDINRMHRYRDAIVVKGSQSVGSYKRIVSRGIVLFPLADENGFQGHRFHDSIRLVGVGGLPCLPRAVGMLDSFIENLLATVGIMRTGGGVGLP